MIVTKKCSMCGSTESTYWRGKKQGKIKCSPCYAKARKKERKAKANFKIYNMWEA